MRQPPLIASGINLYQYSIMVSGLQQEIRDTMPRLNDIDMFWHAVDVRGKGLAYCGITLIPPTAHPEVLEIIRPVPKLKPLSELVECAIKEQRYIIHFGI